ncbi:MAG: M2 family metallopeptidase [Actinomycetota bacterium]
MSAPPHRLVANLTERLHALETAFYRAYWDSQVSATPENERRRAELEVELRRARGDPEALAAVETALGEPHHDPVFRRQLEVLKLSLTEDQMEEARRAEIVELSSAVENDFAAHRPELDGKPVSDNDIEEILKTSNDEAERRAAWDASKQIGAIVADRVRELARLRNQSARDLGFADFYRMSLELQEIPERWLFDLLDEVEALTTVPFARWKGELDDKLRARFGVDQLYPWHYADPFFQQAPPDGTVNLDRVLQDADAPAFARATFARWGIDISDVLAVSDLYPRPGKCQHAFCIDIDRSGKDVRVLANVVPGERWVEVMLHECGHAAYDLCIDPRLPYLLHDVAHTFVTEAIALLSGRLVHDARWLTEVAGVDRREVDVVADRLRRAEPTQSLLLARWILVMAHFERELYADPETDLDALWWELVAQLQLVTPPPDRKAPDWAAKIHIAAAPVYYHNYLLGDLLASQLKDTLERSCGGLVDGSGVGALLRERIFRPGSVLRWDALIEQATGKPLSPEHFAREVDL